MKKILITIAFLIGLNANIYPVDEGEMLERIMLEMILKEGFNGSMKGLMKGLIRVKLNESLLQEDLNLAVFIDDIDCLKSTMESIAENDSPEVMKLRVESISSSYNPFVLIKEQDGFRIHKPILEGGLAEGKPLSLSVARDFKGKLIPFFVPIEMLSEALIVAATYGSIKCLKHLLENGADHNYRNKEGEVAIVVAFDNEQEEIIQYLMEYEKKDRFSSILVRVQ